MNLFRAISTVGFFTLLSRLAGFVRDILIARFLGAGLVADAFFVALRFPNLFRSLFAEGAFSAAFVPLFAGQLESDGRDAARQFARDVFSMMAFILVVFIALMEIAMPWVMAGLAPGFGETPGKIDLTIELSRIAFPYLLFISLSCLQSGILNSLGRFAAAAATPIFLNLSLIAALLVLVPFTQTPGHALAWGVFGAGLIQFGWLAWHCWKVGFPVRLSLPKATPLVKRLLLRALPVAFGSSVYQINLLVGTLLASLVAEGAVSYLYYADRITQLPLGVIGIAVSTALLPLLTRQLKSGELTGARWSQNRAMEIAMLLTLPAAAALMIIATPVIAALFERGEFTTANTIGTASAIVAYASGLPAYVLVKVLTPSFYAREDTLTPVLVAVVALVTNVILNLILMRLLGHVGIALSTSLASWLNAAILAVILHRRGLFRVDRRLALKLPGMFLATGLMGASLWALGLGIESYGHATSDLERIAHLVLLVVGGSVTYIASIFVLRVTSVNELKTAFRRTPAQG